MRRSGSGGTVLARSLPPRFARNERVECARCQEGEVLESFVSKKRGCKAALKLLRKMMKRYPRSDAKPPEIRHCPFCRLLPLQPAKASLFMGQLQAQARPCTRPVASTRGGLISCRRWRTQICKFPLTVPEEMKKYYAELK